MNTNTRNFIIVLAALAVAGVFWYTLSVTRAPSQTPQGQNATSMSSVSTMTLSDGTVTMHYDSNVFGLAVNKTQILVHSYIPPCDDQFNYCFYYIGNQYQGTNFESAGIRIQKRTDLATENACLTTSPYGFDTSMKTTATTSGNGYSSSVFGNVGQGAAGHLAAGSLYRLFVKSNSTCYEFETRIGQSQFANYPPGAIKEFTVADQAALTAQLKQFVQSISLPSGAANLFPNI